MRTVQEIQSTYDELTSRKLSDNLTVGDGGECPECDLPHCSDGDCPECDEVHCTKDDETGRCEHCSAVHVDDGAFIKLEGTGVPLIPDIDGLRAMWTGKHVRTSRILTRDEYAAWVGDPDLDPNWHEGYDWGGEGVVIGFCWDRGNVWLISDEGFDWRIDAHTTITETVRPAAGFDDYRKPCGCTLAEGCYQCCRICDLDAHRCPGCGAPTSHGWACCPECRTEVAKKASA
jgi:hypothetical protein